ncbi:helix-turn-helix domain-containing protein [Niallia sp. JL1B1071]|uniref:AlbA family DNA-binding domain-containing protein n=1 Tax=Niallia tiangongensis TaxID=3237105 RepID=UPI0037DC314E
MDIRQIIMAGETNTVEFKSWIKTPKYKEMIDLLVKEAVGLTNTKGGIILVGVEDDGEITGCTKFDEQNIIEAVYDKTMPKLFTDIDVIEIDNKKILKVNVEKSSEIVSTSNGITYRRLGKNTKPYYPSEYNSNKISGFKGDYSAKIIENSSEEDIDFIEVENLKRKLQSRDKDSTQVMFTVTPRNLSNIDSECNYMNC